MTKRTKHMTNTQLHAASGVLVDLIADWYRVQGIEQEDESVGFQALSLAYTEFRRTYHGNRVFLSEEGKALTRELRQLDPSRGQLLAEFSIAGVEWGSSADTVTYRLRPVNGVELEVKMSLDRRQQGTNAQLYDVRNPRRKVTRMNALATMKYAPAGPNTVRLHYGSSGCELTADGVYVLFSLGWVNPQGDITEMYEDKTPQFKPVMLPGNCEIVREFVRKKSALDMAESDSTRGKTYISGLGARFGSSIYYTPHVFIDNLAERLVSEGAKESLEF